MFQTLCTQFSPIVSMDGCRQQNRFDSSQSHFSSAKRSRDRGVLLSQQKWQKLTQAGVLHKKLGQRYTYEQLSDRSLLDVRIVSRLLRNEKQLNHYALKAHSGSVPDNSIDSTAALSVALLINSAILIVAAATLHGSGNQNVAEIQDAYQLLTPLLGVSGASAIFGVALSS